ncbi:MAG: NAD(P)H-dependent oxidoreductase subunit E [Rhodothermales bacterium]|nr:NAD(P)H-dependent oxidoreductase subunit E [Rhodothermales bacterium]
MATNNGAQFNRHPEPTFSSDQLVFTSDEKSAMQGYLEMYPEPEGAIMRGLWLAQEKFGFLPPEVIRLVADELGIPYARAYGVATFYTQYFKQKKGTYVLDVCTCFSCQVCGGYDILHYLEDKLGIKAGETSEDGLFTIQEAECLGACGSAPMLQITNGRYVHNLTESKVDSLVSDLKDGKMPAFESVTLPQDETEMGGNRRDDVESLEYYKTPPVAETFE